MPAPAAAARFLLLLAVVAAASEPAAPPPAALPPVDAPSPPPATPPTPPLDLDQGARVACGAQGCVVTPVGSECVPAPGLAAANGGSTCPPGTARAAPPSAHRQNFALAKDGAKVLAANPGARKPAALLDDDGDTFLRNECGAPSKFVILELSQVASLDAVELSQHELYSSRVAEFEVLGRASNPRVDAAAGGDLGATLVSGSGGAWETLGSFVGADVRGTQVFPLPRTAWVKYVALKLVGHHGDEPVCAVNDFRAYGVSAMEDLEARLAVQDQEGGAGGESGGVVAPVAGDNAEDGDAVENSEPSGDADAAPATTTTPAPTDASPEAAATPTTTSTHAPPPPAPTPAVKPAAKAAPSPPPAPTPAPPAATPPPPAPKPTVVVAPPVTAPPNASAADSGSATPDAAAGSADDTPDTQPPPATPAATPAADAAPAGGPPSAKGSIYDLLVQELKGLKVAQLDAARKLADAARANTALAVEVATLADRVAVLEGKPPRRVARRGIFVRAVLRARNAVGSTVRALTAGATRARGASAAAVADVLPSPVLAGALLAAAAVAAAGAVTVWRLRPRLPPRAAAALPAVNGGSGGAVVGGSAEVEPKPNGVAKPAGSATDSAPVGGGVGE